MARLSQSLLANLGRPAYQESMFGLGQAIGGLGSQRREQQQKQEEAGMLAGLTPGSLEYNQAMAQIAQKRGDLGQAAQVGTIAEKQRQDAEALQAERSAIQGQLQSLLQSKQVSPAMKQQAFSLLKSVSTTPGAISDTVKQQAENLIKILTAPPGQNFVVVGNQVLDKNTGEFIKPADAVDELSISDLKEIATPKSIVTYIQSGDRSTLVPLAGESEKTEQTYVSELKEIDSKIDTADKALGLVDEYFPLTYDIAQYLPLTNARELSTYVETLQSNLAFGRLQKMRDESKTGGALGQVSNIELRLLQSSVAALDPGSSNFAEQVKVVRKSYQDFKNALLGKPPSGERYLTKDGVLYYELEDGTYENLTEKARLEEAANMGVR